MSTVKLDDGKYTINMDEKTGAMTFYRNGEPWTAGQEGFQHAKVVYCMVARILELEEGHAGMVEALRNVDKFSNDPGVVKIAREALAAAGVK